VLATLRQAKSPQRGELDRVVGTKINDLLALKNELQSDVDLGWNAQKIAAVHGQEAANAPAGSVDRNKAFRQNYQDVMRNSQTAQRLAAANALKVSPAKPASDLLSTTGTGIVTAIGKKALNVLGDALQRDPTKKYGELAKVEQGAARDARIQSIVDALDGRGTLSRGELTSLGAAIGANTYLRDRAKGRG
jgi:hypothetical protein